MARIELRNITKKFGAHTALKSLNLDIADGEFFVLLGETGAGGYRGASYCAHAGPPSAPSPISSAAMIPALKKINRPSLQTAN